MSPSFCAPGMSTLGGNSRPLALENLESRRLLANTGIGGSYASFHFFLSSQINTAIVARPVRVDPPPVSIMPAIPLDDRISPVTDCPDLDGRFCLPTDSLTRPTRHVAKFGILESSSVDETFRQFVP